MGVAPNQSELVFKADFDTTPDDVPLCGDDQYFAYGPEGPGVGPGSCGSCGMAGCNVPGAVTATSGAIRMSPR